MVFPCSTSGSRRGSVCCPRAVKPSDAANPRPVPYRGNAYGSTLRLTLGCLLADQLGIELRRVGSGTRLTFGDGEQALSEWMRRQRPSRLVADATALAPRRRVARRSRPAAQPPRKSRPRLLAHAHGRQGGGEGSRTRASGRLTSVERPPKRSPPAALPASSGRWAGMDVGGRRKGFHAALIDDDRLLRLERLTAVADAVAWLRELAADLVAIDSPRTPAPPGEKARAGERAVATSICNIRWTPDRARLDSNPEYYEWIEHGFGSTTRVSPLGSR